MPYKSDYINVIISRLSSVSEMNFQDMSANILRLYFKQQGFKFEKPEPARGDSKNDGWVPEQSIYYQMYSPVNFPTSFIRDIYNKFKTDFFELADLVFNEHKWSGTIHKFYFLVNTRDRGIPRDDERIVDKAKVEVENKYGCVIDCVQIVNNDYIRDLLLELTPQQLQDLIDLLGFRGDLDIIDVTPKSFIEFVGVLCNALLDHELNGIPVSFDKIPDEEKIIINNLQDREDRINKITAHLGAVEEAIGMFTDSGSNQKKIQSIINYCIGVYLDLKQTLNGAQLYDAIIERIYSCLPNGLSNRNNVEFLVVYIFDRCDIFERPSNVTAE